MWAVKQSASYTSINDFEYPHCEGCGWHDRRTRGNMDDGIHINCVYLDGHTRAIVLQNSTLHIKGHEKASPLTEKGEPAWYNCKVGTGKCSTGQNWDPAVWVDKFEDD